MKKIMKKISGALCAFVLMASLVWVNAATNEENFVYDMDYVTGLQTINPSTFSNFSIIQDDYMSSSYNDVAKIPAEYDFTPRYVEGKTTISAFGLENNRDISGSESSGRTDLIGFGLNGVNTNKAGEFGFLFSNVGTYQGKEIDMKVTVKDFGLKTNGTNQLIAFVAKTELAIMLRGLLYASTEYTFYEHGTNTPIAVKGFMTDADIDWTQGIIYNNNQIKQGYIANDTRLKYKDMPGNKTLIYYYPDNCEYEGLISSFVDGTCNYNEDRGQVYDNGVFWSTKAMFTYAFEGTSFSKTMVNNDHRLNSVTERILASYALTAVEPSSYKTISDKDETNVTNNTLSSKDEEFTYRVSEYLPELAPTYYYTSYALTDTVDNRLDIISAKVYNEAGDELSDLFDIVTTNNKITATAKNTSVESFYGQGYILEIKVKIKDSVEVDGSIELKNVGATIINGKETPTNEVTTKYTPETVTVPATDAFIPLLISCIASLLILIGITGYYFANKRKLV